MISNCIKPHRPLHYGPGTGAPCSFRFEDQSTVIFPKLPNGKSIRVVIIRRTLTTNAGTVFHVCRNAGKWSYRIDYAFKKNQTTRMTKARFLNELRRMGAENYIELLFETV